MVNWNCLCSRFFEFLFSRLVSWLPSDPLATDTDVDPFMVTLPCPKRSRSVATRDSCILWVNCCHRHISRVTRDLSGGSRWLFKDFTRTKKKVGSQTVKLVQWMPPGHWMPIRGRALIFLHKLWS